MKRHRWYRPGSARRGGSRKCVDCGLRRRIKKGTRTSWDFQVKAGEVWLSVAPPCDDVRTSPAVTPEPAPVRTDSPAVWPLVLADVIDILDETPPSVVEQLAMDMHARDVEGRRKYGTPLQVENGRNAAVDAYQEALDLTVYARQRWERQHTRAWCVIYEDALKLTARICAALMEEGR